MSKGKGKERVANRALIRAFFMEREEQVEPALKQGANPTRVRDYDDHYQLHLAACRGWLSAVDHLLKAGANPNELDEWGCGALFVSDDGDGVNSPGVTSALIKAGAKLNLQDMKGRSALMRAVLFDQKKKVLMLLEAGADPCLLSSDGFSALSLAIRAGWDMEMLRAFLINGGEREADREGAGRAIEAAELESSIPQARGWLMSMRDRSALERELGEPLVVKGLRFL